MAYAHCMLDTWGYKHTLTICKTYCFSTTTMVTRKRLIVTFYVHCPSPGTFRSPGLCELPVAVPFQTNHLQSTDVPHRRCCTNLSFTLYLQTQITPFAILRLVSAGSRRHARRHCNVHSLTVLTHCLYWEKVSGSTVNTCQHTWNWRKEWPNFEMIREFLL